MSNASVVLLDIEGTTSSIEFVYDVLFPYVRGNVRSFLKTHFDEADTRRACERMALDASAASLDEFTGGAGREAAIEKILAEVFRLMDADSKAAGLKELQGLVSKEGYESGQLRSHFYPDVPPALEAWTRAGIQCCVYSSGSVAAQKSFYRHAEAGDLSKYISANFDTSVGPKREPGSYAAIAAALNAAPEKIVFFSDVPAELDAAKQAGMQTVLVVRPGNKPIASPCAHPAIHAFDFDIALSASRV